MREKFYEALQMELENEIYKDIEDKNVVYRHAATLASSIETAMFKKFNALSKSYSQKARSLLFNLKDEKNPGLRCKLLSGDLTPKKLADLDGKELASEAKQSERKLEN